MKCKATNCDRDIKIKKVGYCQKHYANWYRTGNPIPSKYNQHGISTATAKTVDGRNYVRELARTRDRYTCQTCGKVWRPGSRRLDVHHLDGLCGTVGKGNDKLSDLPILITLCHRCHFNHPLHSKAEYFSRWNIEKLQLLREQGISYRKIGVLFGVSGQRIQQVIKSRS